VIDAAMQVQTGAADVVVAGGVESMSNIEYYSTDMRWGSRAGSVTLHDRLQRGRERSQPQERFGYISGMLETAENLAKDYAITREQADAFALRSHQRAAAAWQPAVRRRAGHVPCRRRRASRSCSPRRGHPRRDHHGDAREAQAGDRRRHVTAATRASRTTPPPPAWWWPRTSWPS
jgi:hypothetical protein